MIKYFKDFIGNYENAEFLQTLSLVLFVVFFITLVIYVYSKPNSYYEKISEMPLEDDNTYEENNITKNNKI